MEEPERAEVVRQLADAFGEVVDVTPAPDQPLHVMFKGLILPRPWTPRPARALAIFSNWPEQRPEFYVDPSVVNAEGQPPRNPSDHYKVGETWRGFSFGYEWPQPPATAVRAIQLWVGRFREAT